MFLIDWLLKLFLPKRPRRNHLIAASIAILILASFVALQSASTIQNPQTPAQESAPTQIPLSSLVGNDKKILNSTIVNLDGIGTDEILVSYEWDDSNSAYPLHALDVYAHSPENAWKNALHIGTLEDSCGLYDGNYSIINLLGDNTRQIVIRLNCGTGAWLEFEIYTYRGIGFLERLYRNPKPDNAAPGDPNNWMESLIYVFNENLLVSKPDGLYQFKWDKNLQQPAIEKISPESLGSNYVIVKYWLNNDGIPVASPNTVEIKLGQCLFMQKEDPDNKIWDARLFFYGDIWDNKQCTDKIGTGYITLWGYEETPLVTVSVKTP